MAELLDPRETDARLAASLEQQCGLVFQSATMKSGTTGEPLLSVRPNGSQRSNVTKATTLIKALLLPATDAELRVALISLEQVTGKKRSDTDAADEYALDRYLRKLRDYPRDIALWVLEQWDERTGDAGRWFPKTAELRDACNALFVWRRALLPALQRYTDRAPEPEPVEAPEDRAEGAARLRALAAQTAAKAAEQERGYFQIAPDRRGAVSDLLDRRRAEEAEHVERVLHGEAG